MKLNMKIIKWAGALLIALTAVGCAKDETKIQGNGISNETWAADKNIIKAEADTYEYIFSAEGKWTATSSDRWLKITTDSGVKGQSLLRFRSFANTDNKERHGTITISVEGFTASTTIPIVQESGVFEEGDGKYRSINEWIAQKMKEVYLWNEPIEGLMLDYSIDYQKFLTSILDGVAAQYDVNHDDGIWEGAKRTAYYTQIQSNAPVSKAVGSQYTDAGFMLLQPTTLSTEDGISIGAAVKAVTPDTPADKAGLKRGDFITEVDGAAITDINYKTLVDKLYKGNVSAKVNTVSWNGPKAIITYKADVQIGQASYTDPAIYMNKVINGENGKKIGYILYMGFATAYDDKLLEIFSDFKKQGVTDLIIDLRYNPGGEVLSSTVMNTLIAGPAHKGKISTKLVYNSTRTAAGESGEYKIGIANNVEYPHGEGYTPIATALEHSLGLSTVYVITSKTTASASEIVINGLRGLGITVNTVGEKTGGKNVGMEGFQENMYGYNFNLFPVSFYPDNAKGFHDYPDGFEPDLPADDSTIYPGDFGTKVDLYCFGAIRWIETGQKPDFSTRPHSVSASCMNAVGQEKINGRFSGSVIYLDRESTK